METFLRTQSVALTEQGHAFGKDASPSSRRRSRCITRDRRVAGGWCAAVNDDGHANINDQSVRANLNANVNENDGSFPCSACW